MTHSARRRCLPRVVRPDVLLFFNDVAGDPKPQLLPESLVLGRLVGVELGLHEVLLLGWTAAHSRPGEHRARHTTQR